MSSRATLILFAVLAALCAGYWFMTRMERQGLERQAEAKKVFDFPAEDITAIEVRRAEEAPTAAQRAPGADWAMVKPNATIEANQVVWDREARAIAGLDNERTIEQAGADLAKYGLDAPVLTLSATTARGGQGQLAFGAVDPTQSYRYAREGEGPVFLASTKTFQEMDRSIDMLRNPYVISVGKEGVKRIEFSWFWKGGKDGKPPETAAAKERAIGEESVVVALEKSAQGRWRLVSPIEGDANQEQVEQLVKFVQFAVGHNYVEAPQNLTDYGLDPPAARITLFSESAKEGQTLYLGSRAMGSGSDKKEGGIYGKQAARPAVFVLDAQLLDLLPKTPDGFRENRLFTHQATEIKTLRYVTRDTDVTLENEGKKGWRLTKPAVEDIDQQAMSNFIVLLKALTGRGFPGQALPEFGLETPRIAIEFTFFEMKDKKVQPPANIRVGAQVPNVEQYYAAMDTGVVTLLNGLEVSALTKTLFDFRRKTLLPFTKTEAVQVSLQLEGTNYVFEKVRGQWRIKEPAGRALGSASDMDAILDALSAASAVAVETETAPADPGVYGLDAPLATVSVGTSKSESATPETTVGPLLVGKPAPDNAQQRFAGVEGRPSVYRIKQAVVDDLRGALKGIH